MMLGFSVICEKNPKKKKYIFFKIFFLNVAHLSRDALLMVHFLSYHVCL